MAAQAVESMKRVLYIDLSPNPGGSNFSLFYLVRGLDRTRFVPLVVLTTVNRFDRFDHLPVSVERVRVPRWERQSPGVFERVRDSKAGDGLRRGGRPSRLWRLLGGTRRAARDLVPVVPPLVAAIRRFQPDLVHLNDSIPLVRPGLLASRLVGVPAISHCRSFALPTAGDVRWLLPGVSGLIFISQAVADAQLAGVDHPPLHRVIPNAVDLAEFNPVSDPGSIRHELGVPADVPLVGMIGRISPWKGQHVFVEALARLGERFPHVHGLIVGYAEEAEGPGYADRVRRQADGLGLASRLRMTGFRRDVPRILEAVDLVVHCSVQPEPFGRTIVEGMAAGRAVVASAAGGALEIITDGIDGLLTPPGDAGALADAMAKLLSDPSLRTRLGLAARQTVSQRYAIGSHVAAVAAFYETLLDGQ